MHVEGVEITKADKALFPDGTTKGDLAEYYAGVADVMLPHLADRPVNMQRFPDGVDAGGFYEKKVPSYFPDWVRTVEVATDQGRQRQVVVDDARSLVYLAQQACLTPHTWLSRTDDLDRPDQLVLDLDPSTDEVEPVRRAAHLVGDLLDDLGLTAYLKTTGSRGYHVLVPLRPHDGFDEVRGFAREVAHLLVSREPDLLTVEQRKAKRGDRVLVDVMRNGYGQTAVPPYAVRARDGAPVSTPIEWAELATTDPASYTLASVRRRLAQRDDPWKGLRRHAQSLAKPREKLSRLAG
ncbi:MAG: DNA ligase [Nocardioidaceae bacterium]|nr:DNA ligase [Nocardioidaceae bacterium]NUS52803.1 DNA ligase [Nocardioidaceae bacterium]